MSAGTRRKNEAKAVLDRAIHKAFRSVGRRGHKRAAFEQLLQLVRSRAGLLTCAPPVGRFEASGRARIVLGLASLAAHHRDWLRPAETWEPDGENPLPQFTSLARHVLAAYPVPAFMTSVWFRKPTAGGMRQQGWYQHIGSGRNIRTADLPLPYTKRMAHHFLQAPDHFTVEEALRWGQVRGLGGSEPFTRAVIATRLGRSFESEDFSRTVVHFFINHPTLDMAHVGPIVEYLHHQKYIPQEVLVEEGNLVKLGPPQPGLAMKGRTPASLLRQVAEWHGRRRQPPRVVSLRWGRSDIGELRHDEQDGSSGLRRWTIRELLTSGELYREGEAMRHCVASYVRACFRRETTIWSLRFEVERRRYRVMTIEVNPATRTICEARRRGNTSPNAKARGILERWAHQERLTVGC